MSLVVPGWPATFGPVKARRVVHGPVARAAGANVFPLASEGSGFNADFPRPLRAAREVPAGDTVSRLPSDPAVTAEASELVLSLVRRQRVLEAERAGRLFLSRGQALSVDAGRALVRALLATGEAERAVACFRAQQTAGAVLPGAAYTDLIAGLTRLLRTAPRDGSARSTRLPLQLWDELRDSGLQLDTAAYSAAAGAFAAAGKLTEARRLVTDMDGRGLSPGVRMYNVLISAAGRMGDLSSVDSLVADMKRSRIPPNEATHGALVSALVRCNQLERAAATLRAAQARNPPPGVQAYTALIQGYARVDDFARIAVLLTEMRAAGVPPNVVTFSILADGLVRLQRLDEAREVLLQMAAEGVVPNTVTYNTLLRGFAATGRLLDGLRMLTTMTNAGVLPSGRTFNTLLCACARDGDMAAAEVLLKRMREAGHAPDVVTFTTLIAGYDSVGNIDAALTCFAEMRAAPNVVIDRSAYNAILAVLASAGRMADVDALVASMFKAGVALDVVSYGAIADGCARCRNVDGAFDAYDACLAAGLTPDVGIFEALLRVCIRAERFDRATSVLSTMEERGLVVDPLKYRSMLSTLYSADSGRTQRRQTRSGALRRPKMTPRSPALEQKIALARFLAWVGLPSRLYSLYDGEE